MIKPRYLGLVSFKATAEKDGMLKPSLAHWNNSQYTTKFHTVQLNAFGTIQAVTSTHLSVKCPLSMFLSVTFLIKTYTLLLYLHIP